ncbi:MAG: AbrB/MazE/SpoVT family DNA-binding domain-containing protein [Atopobiaceae bacterium]|nr:AbrB/MazE/SpoVT family DNA-binding domain-containing protein [Atopobiaceae bacterium]
MICITSNTTPHKGAPMTKPKGKGAWTATVGTKGQIVIPKEARDMFGIRPGDTLIILGDEERGLAIPPKEQFDEWIRAAFGGDVQ